MENQILSSGISTYTISCTETVKPDLVWQPTYEEQLIDHKTSEQRPPVEQVPNILVVVTTFSYLIFKVHYIFFLFQGNKLRS